MTHEDRIKAHAARVAADLKALERVPPPPGPVKPRTAACVECGKEFRVRGTAKACGRACAVARERRKDAERQRAVRAWGAAKNSAGACDNRGGGGSGPPRPDVERS